MAIKLKGNSIRLTFAHIHAKYQTPHIFFFYFHMILQWLYSNTIHYSVLCRCTEDKAWNNNNNNNNNIMALNISMDICEEKSNRFHDDLCLLCVVHIVDPYAHQPYKNTTYIHSYKYTLATKAKIQIAQFQCKYVCYEYTGLEHDRVQNMMQLSY